MKKTTQPKLHISISKEHSKYQSAVADAFKGLDVSFDGGLMRFSAEEMAMQVILNIGLGIASSAIWDVIKVGIKNLHRKFKTVRITLRDSDSIIYTVKSDLSVTILAVPDRMKEFEHIKNVDDLVKHLKNKTDPTIPIGWKRVTLGDLFDFKNGLNSEKENFGHGLRFINIMEILKHDSLVAKDIPGRINVDPKRIRENIVEYGDVVFNRTSETPDEVGMTSVYLDTEPVVFGGFVIRAKPKSKELNDLFKKYCFSSEQFRKEVIKNSQGVVRGNIGQGDLKAIPFLLPPIKEQEHIASILESWNKLIDKLIYKIEIKKQIKRSLMQELLTGKKRLSSFNNKWETVELGDVSKMGSGGTPLSTNESFYGGGIPWVSITDMTSNGKYIYKTVKTLSEQGLENSPAKIYPKGTILYAMYASIGECSIAGVEMTSSQAILGIIPEKEKLDSIFLYYYLSLIKERIKLQGQQGTQSNLNAGMVREFILDIPSVKEQKQIAKIIETSDEEINELENKLSILKEQKRYLLNNLITGKIRTPETLSTKITK